MFGQTWNNGTLRKYVIYFGTLFSNVILQRDDENDNDNNVQTMKVPLNYGPKEKFLARSQGDPELDRNIAISLPRMSFEMINIAYDPQRKLNAVGRVVAPSSENPNLANYQYNPVPYDIEFSLYIMVKNAEDGTRIIEQIIPFFTPEWTATLNLNETTQKTYDIPIFLNSISQEDTYEGDFSSRRAIIWTLNFGMKGYIFGPNRSAKVITKSDVNFRIPPANVTISDATVQNSPVTINMAVKPGLTVDGTPVSYYGSVENTPSNAIDRNSVLSNSNFGWIVEFEENI